VAAAHGVGQREARRLVADEEAARRAFLEKHFRARLGDPEVFDIVVNTQVLGVEGAVTAVQAALAHVPLRQPA
jgi:cytidylate kinase